MGKNQNNKEKNKNEKQIKKEIEESYKKGIKYYKNVEEKTE